MADIKATKVRTEFFALIKNTIKRDELYHIHHCDGDAVLISKDEYGSLQESLKLISITGFRETIVK